jgi:hypothetical protein
MGLRINQAPRILNASITFPFFKQHFIGQDFNQAKIFYIVGFLRHLIHFIIWLKFYQDRVF